MGELASMVFVVPVAKANSQISKRHRARPVLSVQSAMVRNVFLVRPVMALHQIQRALLVVYVLVVILELMVPVVAVDLALGQIIA